jgi:ankyrin repeat protein
MNNQLNSRTALMEACDCNMVENVKLPVGNGADVNVVDGKGNTPMDIAAYKGYNEILAVMLDVMN